MAVVSQYFEEEIKDYNNENFSRYVKTPSKPLNYQAAYRMCHGTKVEKLVVHGRGLPSFHIAFQNLNLHKLKCFKPKDMEIFPFGKVQADFCVKKFSLNIL